jgi:hypothetical protein
MTKINEIERARFGEIIDQYTEEEINEHDLQECSASGEVICLGCVKASLVAHLKNYLAIVDRV